MPQPARVNDLTEQILEVFRAAQASLDREIARLITDPDSRRLARARELRAVTDREMRRIEEATAEWVCSAFPEIYELGGGQGAASIGGRFRWGQVHAEAVTVLAQDTFTDVLTATSGVRDDVKAWIRTEGRRQAGLSLVEGRTAQQAARQFAVDAASGQVVDLLGGPIGMVRYADGSFRRLADYADMLLRTKTAVCFNAGTLNHLGEAGVGFVEVFDGSGCGWASHDDADKAAGTVRSLRDAAGHTLSHPRCRRSFGGRPDVTTVEEAGRAQPSTTAAQREDQAGAERDRAEQVQRAASNRRAREQRATRAAAQRTSRPARPPRTPRRTAPAAPRTTPTPTVSVPSTPLPDPGTLPQIDDLFRTLPNNVDITDQLRPVFEHQVGNLAVRLTGVRKTKQVMYIEGDILDLRGARVGQIRRQIRHAPNGELSVYNALLALQPQVQGSGFATQYLGYLEDWYRRSGVTHIDVHANIDVGGYTWATKGFNWQRRTDGTPDLGNVPQALRRRIATEGPTPTGIEAQRILDALLDPSTWWTPSMPTPKHVAELGRKPGDTMWFGKETLLNTSWHGRKML